MTTQDNKYINDVSSKISSNYSKFLNYTQEFGYGMIIMSIISRQLMGEAFIIKKKIEEDQDK